MAPILEGGCLCGAVRYRLTAALVATLYCHCRMYQRAHGAPAIAWLAVPFAAFKLTEGTPTAYRSSDHAFRHFCGRSGAPLLCHEADSPKYMDVSIASLDTPKRCRRARTSGLTARSPGSIPPTICRAIRPPNGRNRRRPKSRWRAA